MAKRTESKARVAVVQAAPVFLNREGTVEKAAELITAAAAQGASLVLFPESFVPGYPDWVWLVPSGQGKLLAALHAELLANSVSIPSKTTEYLSAAAKTAGVDVAIGICERNDEASGTTLYNTLLYLDAQGNLRGRHRKLVPTCGERLVWAQGDGSDLEVYPTPYGRLGGLICWENYMPLARYVLYAMGVEIYLAPTWDHGEPWLATLRHIAREGRTWVLGCCAALHRDDIPDCLKFKQLYPTNRQWINPGDSAIVDPFGKVVAGPLREREEILVAEVDIEKVHGARWDLDVAGHYARPDVFSLTYHRRRQPLLRIQEESDTPTPETKENLQF